MVRFHKFSQRSALQRDGVTQKRGIGKAQQYLLNFACNRRSRVRIFLCRLIKPAFKKVTPELKIELNGDYEI
jgi:hypothetical protein